eukprot:jgi/Tetstr1/439431/TSEL_027865.t1
MDALFLALDELLPYIPATNQDFTLYLARARNHAEAINKASRFRPAFVRRLNEVKRVHDRNAGLAGCIDTGAAAIGAAALSAALVSPKRISEPRTTQRRGGTFGVV